MSIDAIAQLERDAKKRRQMLGNRIKEMREKHGLTQGDLASRVGVNITQVVKWEKGRAMPGGEAFMKLAKELDVSMDFLAGLVDGPNEHLEIEDLSPTERKLIEAYRRGDWQRLLYELGTSEELARKGSIKGDCSPCRASNQ